MRSPKLSRRAVLRGLGGIAVALPMLEIMSPRRAHAGNPTGPKRLIVFYTPNGFVTEPPYDSWTPSGSETSFTLNGSLAPLAPYQSDLIVLRGTSLDMPDPSSPDTGHVPGMTMQLTGMPTTSQNVATGPSIDSVVADQIGGATKMRAVRAGVQPGWCSMFYSGSQLPIAVEQDPVSLFDAMFGDFVQPPDELAKLRAQRKSVLDAVQDDFTRLDGLLGTDDRARLDAHAQSIRDLEQQLTSGALSGAACSVPQKPGSVTLGSDTNVPTLLKSFIDLFAMGVACDLSRVFALMTASMSSEIVYSWLGLTQGHHTLSHSATNDQTAQSQLTAINTWHAQQFAYLLSKLAAIPEGTGTALDNTVVWWTTDMRYGAHERGDMRHVLAGSAGGYFETGRFVTAAPGHYVNDLHVSLANAVGVPLTTFGNPAWCQGPLPNLAA